MAEYRINGYGLYLGAGIMPDADRATANSFEKPADIVEPFSHTWDDGVVEYDLNSPVRFKPREFVIKGYLFADNIESYTAGRNAVSYLFYQNYVTLEQVDLGIKANALLRNGAAAWNRLTNLSDPKIVVQVEFRFDEVLQPAPFKDSGTLELIYLTDSQGRFYNTQDNRFMII